MAAEVPNSFRDPYWSDLASSTEGKLGLPQGLLVALLTKGEQSNNDQISEKDARTPFQVTKKTRDLVLKRDGIDAFLSPENAAEVAGLVAKDGLNWAKQRTQDPDAIQRLAAGYYHAGGDTANWGPRTLSYMARVTGATPAPKEAGNTFERAMAASTPDTSGSIANVYKAYSSGQMKPEDAADFESAVNGGQIMLPRGATLKAGAASAAPATPSAPEAAMIAAYQSGKMTPKDAADFEGLVRSGEIKLPGGQMPGTNMGIPDAAAPAPAAPAPSFGDKLLGAGEAALQGVTGAIGGTAGMIGGGALGLVQDVHALARGEVNPNNLETLAQAGQQALTYQPRTPVGQQYGDAVTGAMQSMAPAIGLTGELGAMGAMAGPASAQVGAAVRATPGAVVDAVRGAREAVPVAAEAAPSVVDLATTAKSAADGSKSAAQALAEQAAPNPTIVKSAERLGIADYLQPDHVTTNDAFRQLAGAVKSNPNAQTALAEARSLPEVAKRASDLIDEIGGSNDLSAVSASLKQRMQATRDDLSKSEDALYDKLREQIPAKTDAPAPNVLAFIKQRADDLGGAENLTPLEKSIAAKLTPVGDSLDHLGPKAREQLAAQGITGQKQPTYALLDDVRKDVGAAAKMRGPYADADTALAKKLYGELSKDQESVATRTGAADTFDLARKTSALRFGMQDDLAALFGKDISGSLVSGGGGGLPGAVRALASGDSSRIVRLMQAVPPEMRQSVAASGLGTVFRKSATRGEMDFTGYAKWMDGLRRNRQSYAALMSNLPLDARKQLTALYHVSKGISDSMQTRTKTGLLGPIREQMMQPDSLMTNLYSLAKRSAIGAVVEPFTSAIGLHGAGITAALSSALTRGKVKAFAAVDALLASPEFLQLAKSQAGTPARAAAVRTVAMSPAFGKVLRKAGRAMTLSERERWIVQAMQGQPDSDRRRGAPRLNPSPTVH